MAKKDPNSVVTTKIAPEVRQAVYLGHSTGKAVEDMASEFGLSLAMTRALVASSECKALKKAIQEAFVEATLKGLQVKASKLADLFLETLEHHLKEKNLNVLPIYLKLIGQNDDKKSDPNQAQQIVVNMPGYIETKEVKQDGIIEVLDETEKP